jgi:hypothetical protein
MEKLDPIYSYIIPDIKSIQFKIALFITRMREKKWEDDVPYFLVDLKNELQILRGIIRDVAELLDLYMLYNKYVASDFDRLRSMVYDLYYNVDTVYDDWYKQGVKIKLGKEKEIPPFYFLHKANVFESILRDWINALEIIKDKYVEYVGKHKLFLGRL